MSNVTNPNSAQGGTQNTGAHTQTSGVAQQMTGRPAPAGWDTLQNVR